MLSLLGAELDGPVKYKIHGNVSKYTFFLKIMP